VSDHVTDRLSAYLDGALSAQELERVQGHLAGCAGCGRAYAELAALRRLLRGLPDPAVPEGLAERLHWRLMREARADARPRLRELLRSLSLRPTPLRLALACAALALALGLPLGWLSRWGVHETPLDPDAYLRDYLVLSTGRPLTDEVATTLVTYTLPAPEPQTR